MPEYAWEPTDDVLAAKRYERGCGMGGSWRAPKDFGAPEEGRGALYAFADLLCNALDTGYVGL